MTIKYFGLSVIGAILLFLFSFGQPTPVSAAELITLVTDKPAYVNGETVTISWYINTPTKNCIITGPDLTKAIEPAIIDTTALPVTGEYSYVPPNDSTIAFNLKCEKYVPVTVVPVVPGVTTRIDGSFYDVTKYFDEALGGALSTVVSWTSSNATRCSNVIYRSAATGNVWTTVPIEEDEEYINRMGTAGSVRFDGDPRLITETTNFSVGCYNDNEDPVTSSWNSKWITVNAIPVEPPPVSVSIWSSNTSPVYADAVSGYATARINWSAYNADACDERAYRMDGTEIAVPGWSFYSTTYSGGLDTKLATTTKFTLHCWRNARTYNSTVYPASSSTKELIMEVVNPDGGPMGEWDRSDPLLIPPVTVSAITTPNPTYRDALTGNAVTAVSITANNASFCYLRSYTDNDGDGVYTNEYTLSGWTRTSTSNRLAGNYVGTIPINIKVSSRLSIECIREYDLLYGTAEDKDNGIEEFSLIVEVLSPAEPAPDPVVYLYSNAVRETAADIWTKKTDFSGFVGVSGTGHLYGSQGAGLVNRISFPFTHPYGESNAYDVWLQYCNNVVPDGHIGMSIAADDINHVYFNDKYLGSSYDWRQLKYYTPPLKSGWNVIAVEVKDTGGFAGFLAAMKWTGGSIVSDANWKINKTEEPGWHSLLFDDSSWANATEKATYGAYPWYTGVTGFPTDIGARWIWTPNNYYGDTELYLRYSFYVDPDDLVGDGTVRIHTLYDDDGTVLGTHQLPGETIAPIWCNAAPQDRVRIASSVILHDQDTVTLECTNGTAKDNCPINRLYFGAGNNASVVARMDPVTERAKVQMLWFSENTTACSALYAYNPITDTYLGYVDGTGYASHFPAALSVSTSTRYEISCGRQTDTKKAVSKVTVTIPFSSIYSVSTLIFTGECIDDGNFGSPYGTMISAPPGYGPDDDGICAPMVDLSAYEPSITKNSTNNVDGTYDLSALMIIQNQSYNGSGASLPVNSAISYMAILDIMDAHGLSNVDSAIGIFNGSLVAPSYTDVPVQSSTLTQSLGTVPFGTHTLCARVNLDGSPNYAEANPDVSNNTQCSEITLPVPEPPMSIDADRKLIRQGQSVEINWAVNVTYQLQCTVRGPGGLTESFDTQIVGSDYTDSSTTGLLTSTGIYQLQCTEPITNTVFSREVRVEMVPNVEEI